MSDREDAGSGPTMTDERRTAFLSIDFEDWHQVARRDLGIPVDERAEASFARQVVRLLDLLDEIEASATFFVLGASADRYPELVREVLARGHEIGCHGYGHVRVSEQTRGEFRDDLENALETIMRVTGQRPLGYRAPWFSITRDTPWAYAVLHDLGFEYDSSQYDSPIVRRRPREIPRDSYRLVLASGVELLELPVSVWDVGRLSIPIGGGSYWRALPSFLLFRGLRETARSSAHLTLYFHPHEFDNSSVRLDERARLRDQLRVRLQYTRPYANVGRSRIACGIRGAAREFRFVSCEQLRRTGGGEVGACTRTLSTEGVLVRPAL